MKTITFITGNAKKLAEVQAFLPEVQGLNIELPEIQSLDIKEIVTAKIKVALQHCNGPVMVDDTALYLDCMQSVNGSLGLPGPLVKWFLHTMGNCKMAEMAIRLGNTKARACTVIAYATSSEEIHVFEGALDGYIINPENQSGFGWDVVFVPTGYTQTLAQLPITEKNKISMRGIALQKLKIFLQKKQA